MQIGFSVKVHLETTKRTKVKEGLSTNKILISAQNRQNINILTDFLDEDENIFRNKYVKMPTTPVSAFREILQSLQYKIVQYTFLGQYLIKLQDLFSQCKILHPAWLQLDHNKLGLSGMRLFRPLYHKTEKTLFQM